MHNCLRINSPPWGSRRGLLFVNNVPFSRNKDWLLGNGVFGVWKEIKQK